MSMRLASITLLALLTACDDTSRKPDEAAPAAETKTEATADAKAESKAETKADTKAEEDGNKTEPDPEPAKDAPPPTDPPDLGPAKGIPGAAVPIPVETSGPFSLVARAGTRMGLHPLFDDEVAISVGPHLIRIDEDGSVAPDAKLFAGLPTPRDPGDRMSDTLSAWYVVAAGGRWPDEVIMRATIESGFRLDVELPMAMRFDGERWQPMATGNKRYKWWPVEVHPWVDGSLLARRALMPVYEGIDLADPEDEPSEAQQQAAAKAMQRAKTLIVIRGLPKSPDIGDIVAFQSWGNGDIVAVGAARQPELRVANVEGVTKSTKLPVIAGATLDISGVRAKSVDDAYVFGSEGTPDSEDVPYLVHWHGGKIERVPTPKCESIGAVAEDAAGELWALCDNEPNTEWQMDGGSLWHRRADGTWIDQLFPETWGKPTQVVFTAGELWVGTRQAVARTGKVERSVRLGDLDALGEQFFEWGDPIPVGEYCVGVTIRLKSDPKDAEAIKGKLDAAKLAHADGWWQVQLRKLEYRAEEILALEIHGATKLADVRKFERAFEKALGDVLHPAQCYGNEYDESDKDVVGEWSGED